MVYITRQTIKLQNIWLSLLCLHKSFNLLLCCASVLLTASYSCKSISVFYHIFRLSGMIYAIYEAIHDEDTIEKCMMTFYVSSFRNNLSWRYLLIRINNALCKRKLVPTDFRHQCLSRTDESFQTIERLCNREESLLLRVFILRCLNIYKFYAPNVLHKYSYFRKRGGGKFEGVTRWEFEKEL